MPQAQPKEQDQAPTPTRGEVKGQTPAKTVSKQVFSDFASI